MAVRTISGISIHVSSLSRGFDRNIGIVIAFTIGFCVTYILATEYITEKKSNGEILVFRRSASPTIAKDKKDIEASTQTSSIIQDKESNDNSTPMITKQTATFHWEDVCYDIKIKSEERRILDHVDGWVKPGTLTALMVRLTVFLSSTPRY